MKLHRISMFLIITLLLAGCAKGTATSPAVTENPNALPTQATAPNQSGSPTQTNSSIIYPSPSIGSALPTTSAYPAPGGTGSGSTAIPASGYEPQPGDDSLKRDAVTLDTASSQLIVTATEPAQAKAVLTGSMPDPCHNLRVVVTPADAKNIINIDIYSLVDPSTACVTKIEPFTASIPLGSYASGEYTVNVNGSKFGTFQTVFTPQPDDDKLTRGEATVDLKASKVVVSATSEGSVSADLEGYMPDPCHKLRIVLTPADAQGKINLEVYSVFNAKNACITVIQPFEVIFPLGIFSTGHYSVYVNGELLGEFDI